MLQSIGNALMPSPFILQEIHQEQSKGKQLSAMDELMRAKNRTRRKRERQNRRDGRRQKRVV